MISISGGGFSANWFAGFLLKLYNAGPTRMDPEFYGEAYVKRRLRGARLKFDQGKCLCRGLVYCGKGLTSFYSVWTAKVQLVSWIVEQKQFSEGNFSWGLAGIGWAIFSVYFMQGSQWKCFSRHLTRNFHEYNKIIRYFFVNLKCSKITTIIIKRLSDECKVAK